MSDRVSALWRGMKFLDNEFEGGGQKFFLTEQYRPTPMSGGPTSQLKGTPDEITKKKEH